MKVLLIADDFTGSLDTGVKLSNAGLSTAIVVPSEVNNQQITDHIDVLVVNTETRHVSAQAAYQKVYSIVSEIFHAQRHQNLCYYKKTDSLLRGNIGAELKGLMDATGQSTLAFVPAFPLQMRTTMNGIQYLAGRPIDQVPSDPYEPVGSADIAQIIGSQCDYPVQLVGGGGLEAPPETKGKKILVFDAQTNEDLIRIAGQLIRFDLIRLTAGCAGFASVLPDFLKIQPCRKTMRMMIKRLLFVCGSINPVTQSQIRYAQAHGFTRFNLCAQMPLSDEKQVQAISQSVVSALHQGRVIIDTNDLHDQDTLIGSAAQNGTDILKLRKEIVCSLGRIVKHIRTIDEEIVPVFVGGDTLAGFLSQIDYTHIVPVCEIFSGCVLSSIRTRTSSFPVLSKSGAFGNEKMFVELIAQMEGETLCC